MQEQVRFSGPPPSASRTRWTKGSAPVARRPKASLGWTSLPASPASASHRRFLPRAVEPELLRLLCACALSAPSKSDLQQADIVIVRDPASRARSRPDPRHAVDRARAGVSGLPRQRPAAAADRRAARQAVSRTTTSTCSSTRRSTARSCSTTFIRAADGGRARLLPDQRDPRSCRTS